MNISIIIPNYNGERLLKKNLPKVLEAVKDYRKGTIEMIIPDDASSDNSVAVIKDFIEHSKEKNILVKTITNTDRRNGGFSANVNRGVSLASGDILLLLNTDVIPKKGFLEPLLKHFEEKDVFGVGCLDESIEDGKTILRGRGIGQWKRGFLVHAAGDLDKEDTLWVSCGSGAFRKSIWDTLHGLCNIYNPFYWEDVDVSYRARKAGYKTLFEKESIVTHEHEGGAIKKNYTATRIQKLAYRNQFLFVWVNATDTHLITEHILWLPYHLLTSLKGKNWELLSGFFQAVQLLPQALKVRRKNKKLFCKKDDDVILAS
ncbi:MAG TPA: glycosyltransferase [Patescibacteria group bacterium]|nr:glycosyltransferase [Patescibacteria group bacterium]